MIIADIERWLGPVPRLAPQYLDLLRAFGAMSQHRSIPSAYLDLGLIPETMNPYGYVGLHTCMSPSCGIPAVVVHPMRRPVLPTAARRNLIGMKSTDKPAEDEIEYPSSRLNPSAIDELESVVAGLSYADPVVIFIRKLQRFVIQNNCLAFKARISMRRVEDEESPDVDFHVCHDESCQAPWFSERPRRAIGEEISGLGNEICQHGAYQLPRTHLIGGRGVIVVEKSQS